MYTIVDNVEITLLTDLEGRNNDEEYDLSLTTLKEPQAKDYRSISIKNTEWEPIKDPCRALCRTLLMMGDGYEACKNMAPLSFKMAKNDWGTIKGFAIVNYSADVVIIMHIHAVRVVKGDTVSFPKGSLDMPILTFGCG